YSCTQPIDILFTFSRYASEASSPNDGNQPSFWSNLRPNVTNYQKEQFEPAYQLFAGGQTPNILHKRPGIDWYFHMQTESGCSGNEESQFSEPVQVIEVETTPVGQAPAPIRSRVRLDWNRPKPVNANSYPYYVYESPTHFYIWENDSIEAAGQYIGGEGDPNNWYLRGDTTDTTYSLITNVCNARVGFRVEARDTVVIRKQGSRLNAYDELDTLTFRTYSIIDTTLMVDRGFIPAPQLDTIMVLENGDLYFRIDRANAGTAGRFRLYENRTNNIPFANLDVAVDSFHYNGFNANTAVGNFVLESQDACNQNIVAGSDLYSTILLNGQLLQPTCSLNYELSWNQPTGFTSPIRRYEIYVDASNTGFKLEKVVNNASTLSTTINIRKGVDYRFRIIAKDQSNAANISAIHRDTLASNLRSFEIVPAPELFCTQIDSSGAVLLSFAPPEDSTDNGVGYEFEYRILNQINGNWQTFSGSSQVNYGVDNQVLITGINANLNDYEFRARTISGCDGLTPSSYSASISTEGVDVLTQFLDYLYVGKQEAVSYQWFDCNTGIVIPLATSKQFVPPDTGTYGVYIEYTNCSDSSICYAVDNVLDTNAFQLNYNTIESAEESAYYQWYDCRADTLIPGANSRRYTAVDTGYYAVILKAYGYSD
ncbi:MAG: fibronectin type III domain-containing protein, partial [Arenibacter algicola]|nr:fibronectin type III domain-containing protein [Arenibacter algicola]